MLTDLGSLSALSSSDWSVRFRRSAGNFFVHSEGLAGIEFALIVGLLLFLLLGAFDIVPAFLVYSNVGTAAATTADVAAEFSNMQPSDMVDLYSAAGDVMQPFAATSVELRLTSVFSDGNGNAKVHWSCGVGSMPAYKALTTVVNTPTSSPVDFFIWRFNEANGGFQLDGTNSSYIFAEVNYTYNSPTGFVLRSAITMNSVAYYLPRGSSFVGFPWDGGSSHVPTVPASATKTSSIQLSNGAICSYAQ